MFRIFTTETENDLRSTNKALLKQLKAADRINESLQEQLDDQDHETYRSHTLEIRNMREDHEKEIREVRIARDFMMEKMETETDAKIERAAKENKAALSVKDTKVAELQSEINDLKLAKEEDTLDVDLQIQEGINEFKEEHGEEVSDLQVQLAKSQGETKAAQAETKSKDAIIAVLTAQMKSNHDDVETMVELAGNLAPKVSLDKFNINVEVPAPVTVTQKGGDNNKEQKKQ